MRKRCLIGIVAVALVTARGAAADAGTVLVSGQRFGYTCSGTGSPTVVFESGLRSGSAQWSVIRAGVAKTTRACAYDRLGEGRSNPVKAGVVQTVAGQAATLRAVLKAASIRPPYVLVGHSWGGAIAQRFAFAYRGTVAGVVLVDASQADVIDRWLAMLPPAPKNGVDQFAAIRRALEDTLKPSTNPEHVSWGASVPQLHRLKSLGSLPLVVLTAGSSDIAAALPPPFATRSYAIWVKAQQQLAALSSQSVHAIVISAGHMIPTDDPAAVIAAVKRVVQAVRGKRALGACRSVFSGITGIRCI